MERNMKSNVRRACVLIGTLAGVLAATSSDANAFQSLGNPFGSVPTRIFIGATSSGNSFVIWCAAPSRVVTQQIGNASGLFESFQINGANANDDITILASSAGDSCASGLSQAPVYGSHFIDIAGSGGADIMTIGPTASNADSFAFGGNANDLITSFSPISQLFGGSQNDVVKSMSFSSSDSLFGEDGDDCLYDRNKSYQTLNCGAGNDGIDSHDGAYFLPTPGCEFATSSCTYVRQ
jgi:Ca2+-binding RTX toxin-like protein